MRDFAKLLESTIVFLGGDEGVLRQRSLHALVQAASEGDDFDVENFSGDTSSPVEWLASCGTTPFLSPRRVSVVRHVLRSDGGWELLGTPQLPTTALLILVADNEGGDDQKQRTMDSRHRNWEKAVKAAKGVVVDHTVDEKAIAEFLRQELESQRKKMSPKAVTTLIEMTGANLSNALDELEKLVLFSGSAEQINESDVRDLVMPSREWNIFKLSDAILNGRGNEALSQLRILIGSSTKAESAAFGSILPNLTRQFRLLWQARLFIDRKASFTSVPDDLTAMLPSTPNIVAQKEYPRKLAMQGAQKVTLEQLSRCFAILSDTEARIKGQLPCFSAIDALEQMVLEMIDALSLRRAS